MLSFVFYVYTVEVEKRSWSMVLAGLAFWGMDWFNEIWNSLVFHFTNHAPGLRRARQNRIPHPYRSEHRDMLYVRYLGYHLDENAAPR